MTNPACETCNGWGFKNEVIDTTRDLRPVFSPAVMVLCDDVYPSHDRIPPYLRGQPCTPRTDFRRSVAAPPTNRIIGDDRMVGGMRLASEKAAETRARNAAAKAPKDGEGHKPSRDRRSR